jgi:lysophospholipase L1-like esterase
MSNQSIQVLTNRAQLCYNYPMKIYNVALSWCKKNSFPVLLLLLIIFPVLLMPSDMFPGDDSTIKRGEIFAGDKLFKYEKNYDFLNIYDTGNNLVFSAGCEEKNTVIKSFGYSKIYNSFFVFKEKFNPEPINFELSMEFENFTVPVIPLSETAFYTPLLVETGDDSYIIHISEDFSIGIYDLQKKQLLHKVRSETPVIKLAVGKPDNRDIVEFYQFVEGKYRKHFFYIDDIETNRINFFPYEKDEKKGTGPIQSEILLDYKKFIGFGDSITVGKIGSIEMPELGYIPRLQLLLNDQLYEDAEVINEGFSGGYTGEAVDRIEPVILSHLGKYLLFHNGTNDVIAYNLPTSTVIANIEFIMIKTLGYNVQPILTTLIPRHGKRNEALQRERGFAISQGIKKLAQSLDIPVIDLWDIFLYYPDSDGGYISLMSDHVHPSEKGYQLMAEEWLRVLLALPPPVPTGFTILNRSRNQIGVQWVENSELDVVQYLIKFGYSPSRLNRIVTTSTSYYLFIYNPLFPPFNRKIYFQVQAVDNRGNGSEFTPLQEVEFNEIGSSSLPSPPIISLPPFILFSKL